MRTIQASEFKAKCLSLMDEVAVTGESLVVTKHGKPIVELKPVTQPRALSPIGLDKGRIEILGDIVAPVYEGDWDALE